MAESGTGRARRVARSIGAIATLCVTQACFPTEPPEPPFRIAPVGPGLEITSNGAAYDFVDRDGTRQLRLRAGSAVLRVYSGDAVRLGSVRPARSGFELIDRSGAAICALVSDEAAGGDRACLTCEPAGGAEAGTEYCAERTGQGVWSMTGPHGTTTLELAPGLVVGTAEFEGNELASIASGPAENISEHTLRRHRDGVVLAPGSSAQQLAPSEAAGAPDTSDSWELLIRGTYLAPERFVLAGLTAELLTHSLGRDEAAGHEILRAVAPIWMLMQQPVGQGSEPSPATSGDTGTPSEEASDEERAGGAE